MKQLPQDVKNSFLLSAAVSIILGIVLIVYPVKNEFADLLYRRSTAPVWRRCCVDPLHCKPRRAVFLPLRSVRCPGTDSVRLLRYL